jgi:hypothetical protein
MYRSNSMKKRLWWLVVVGLVLTLVGQYAYHYVNLPYEITTTHAAWRPVNSFADVLAMSSTVVDGDVVSISPGPDNVVQLDPKSTEPGGVDVLPTTMITIRVRSAEKGNAAAGQEITVHQTGGVVQYPQAPDRGSIQGKNNPEKVTAPQGLVGTKKPGEDTPAPPAPADRPSDPSAPGRVHVNVVTLEEDPPYQVGQHVFLALEDRPGASNVKQIAHPAGRYNVTANNVLQAVSPDDVSQSVNGHAVADAARAAHGQGEIPNRPNVQKRVTTPGMPSTGVQVSPVVFSWIGLAIILIAIGMALISFVPRLIPRRKREE